MHRLGEFLDGVHLFCKVYVKKYVCMTLFLFQISSVGIFVTAVLITLLIVPTGSTTKYNSMITTLIVLILSHWIQF